MKIVFDGLAEIQADFDRMEKNASQIIKQCVYVGAGIVADEIKKNTPVGEGDSTGHLRDHLGISKIKSEDGFVNAAIDFNGYNEKGRPYAVIARSLESGRSTKDGRRVAKHPFIRKSFNASKDRALKAMQDKFNELIEKK